MRLTICQCCRRHVKTGDSTCPFCGTRNTASGMSSAGLFVAIAVGASALAACGTSDTTPGGAGGAAGQDAGFSGAYGGAVGWDSAAGAAGYDGGYAGAYGGAPPWDASDGPPSDGG